MRVAVYMGVASAGEIAQSLIDASVAQHIGIDIVSNAQRSNQVVVQCSAKTLVETIQRNAIENPAILFFDVALVSRGGAGKYRMPALTRSALRSYFSTNIDF